MVEVFKPNLGALDSANKELLESDELLGCGAAAEPCGSQPSCAFEEIDLAQSSSYPKERDSELARVKSEIDNLVRQYHALAFPEKKFEPGKSRVLCAGRVFDEEELLLAVESSLEFWLTLGRFGAEFEKKFAQFFSTRFATLVNSGSSANLVALSALTSPQLGERRLVPGDEVITVACGFPTTVNPIVQNGLVPVFLDVTIPTYNIDVRQLDAALSSRTKAIMLAHTLGNPFDLQAVTAFAKRHNLFLIEDCCDAVGSTYQDKPVGSFGDLATVSFYPAHHITMGEGGCVLTNNAPLRKLVESFRDWGRDCWCAPGVDNTCGKRFAWQQGTLPFGFDHKYIYSHIGYNLKPTDIQAAIGLAQLDKVDRFIKARRENFQYLLAGMKGLESIFVFPEATANSNPSWFGFPLCVRKESGISRTDLVQYLESHQIATRQIFAGNLVRQPAYKDINCRSVSDLGQSDIVMEDVFWVGLYPGLKQQQLDYMLEVFHKAPTALRRSAMKQGKGANEH